MKLSAFVGFLAFGLASQTAAQDAIPVLRSSLSSGSERLALYSYTEYLKSSRDPRLLNAVNKQMERQAFSILEGQPAPRGLLFKRGNIAPVLSYDDNVNGGNRNSTFDLGGFTFKGDPKYLAKESIVFGAEAGGALRYAYGRGRYFDLSGGVSAVHSPKYDLQKYNAGVSLCSRNHIQGWTFADFCARANRQKTDLSTDTSYSLSASGSQLFSLGKFDHELTATVEKNYYDNYNQAAVGMSLGTSLGKPGSVTFGFKVGEKVSNELHLDNSIFANYRTNIADRPVSFQLARSAYKGGSFFGQDRKDEMISFSVSTQLTKQVAVSLVAKHNDSSVDFYSYDSVGVNFGITGWQF